MQIFELDGYLRLRSDYMHQFFLGQGYYPSVDQRRSRASTTGCRRFPVPLDCPRPTADGRRPRDIPVELPARRTSAARTCASAWSRR